MKTKKQSKSKENYPLVSFVTPMKEKDFRVIAMLKGIRSQDYPQNKIEIIIIDGGSNPEVLKECRKYHVKIFNNPKMLAEGAGMGKDQGIWKSKGKYVVISESDIEYMDKDWLKKMVKPLEEDKEIFASIPRLFIHPEDSATNRYLSYVGVDPFAINRSIEGQLELNYKKLPKLRKPGYDLFFLNPEKPYCMGSNGFMFRRDLIKAVGDYAQDIEFISRLAKAGIVKFAVVDDARVWHKNVKSFQDFLKKRIKWTQTYAKYYITQKKGFNWITSKTEFFFYVLKNMLFFPQIPLAVKKALDYRDSAWLLHPFLVFLSTSLNVYFALTSKNMWNQVFN